MSDSLQPRGLYSPWNSPGHSTGVGSHSSLQGLFLTQRSNAGLPHCGRILYQLSHQGSPTRMGHPVEKRNISSQRLLQALVPHLLGPPSHPVMREPTPHDGKQSEGDLVPGPGAPRPEVCCLWPSPGPNLIRDNLESKL